MRHALILFAFLAGCSKEPLPVPPRALELPSARAMAPPEPLPLPAGGEDLLEKHGQLRAAYGRETAKVTVLQAYITRITRKKATP